MKPIQSYLHGGILASILCSMIAVFAFIGCEHDVYNPEKGKKEEIPNTFDFSTTATIQLNVDYDVPEGYQVLFEVYLEDPFTTDEEGQIVKRSDLEPVIRRMTDKNGAYAGKETIGADHGKEAYIYTSYAGVPTLYKTSFQGNSINARISWEVVQEEAQTRADGSWNAKGYCTLGTWNQYGKPDYLDTDNKIEIPANVLNAINQQLPERGTCPTTFRQSADFTIDDPEGRDVEVSVRLVGGQSAAASAFGYYCYTDESEISKAPKCIIFPNTLMENQPKANKKASGIKPGDCVRLHYFDPETKKDKGTVFPNGTKIGWFLVNDVFYSRNESYIFYSTDRLNSDGRTHTAAFQVDDFIVLSFEDWDDNDYNDIQFNIWSNPIEALKPDIPIIDPEEPEKGYHIDYHGIVAFEDNWPKKGDYDLNDVIVRYNSRLNFNAQNEVVSAEDTYLMMHSGASYQNSFAYQLNTARTNVTTTMTEAPTTFEGQGLDTDLQDATINVFRNALNLAGKTYQVKNEFSTPVPHETFGVPPYNPFIIVHDQMEAPRIEVHLVNHRPTKKADESLFHTEDDLSSGSNYYVASGSYPFAIHLSGATSFSTPEAQPIDASFEHFTDWVGSNGANYKDWYK